jgi:hypothetical protein
MKRFIGLIILIEHIANNNTAAYLLKARTEEP